jgi:hypothetical protein
MSAMLRNRADVTGLKSGEAGLALGWTGTHAMRQFCEAATVAVVLAMLKIDDRVPPD